MLTQKLHTSGTGYRYCNPVYTGTYQSTGITQEQEQEQEKSSRRISNPLAVDEAEQ
jgi:hypothetical protein